MLLMFFLRIKNNTKLAGDVETTNFSIKLFICKHLGGSFLTLLSLLKGKNTGWHGEPDPTVGPEQLRGTAWETPEYPGRCREM